MFVRKLVLLFLFLTLYLKVFPAVFTVTSNADSGPGTLRDALTLAAANGSVTTDYIYFNLADQSIMGRTITLTAQLPNVSSNLVIDGTTQPGPGLNQGDAKVIITVNRFVYFVPDYFSAALILENVNNVSIYGLSINNFYFLQNGYPSSGSIINAAIYLTNTQNIIIGAPNKGNYFDNNMYTIFGTASDFSTDDSPVGLTIQSNYIGFDPASISYVPDGVSVLGHDILFGGDNPLEGNHLLGQLSLAGTNIQVVHNYFGLDSNGNPVNYYPPHITCSGNGADNNVVIRNNISSFLSIELDKVTDFKIYANTDLADKTSVTPAIALQYCSNGIIGSDDITQENIFHGNKNADEIWNNYSNNIQILKNSIICSDAAYQYDVRGTNISIPNISVLVNNNTEYSGTATPNSDIYIYEDNTDCPICNPVTFVTKVQADANGNWKITGNFTGKRLLSNALLNQNSSAFTNPIVPDFYFYQAGSATNPTCGNNNGSIILTGLKNVLKVEWYNSKNIKVGEGTQVNNLGPGTYVAVAYNGNCTAKSDSIYLYNVQPQIIDIYVNIVNPSCGKGGSVTRLIPTTNSQNTASFQWTDQNNLVISNSVDVQNLPAGKYTLTMTDDVSKCTTTYGPVTLTNVSGPNIDQSRANITSTNCGQSTGSITNIQVTGSGTLKYSWLNDQQQQVATTKDLTNQSAGTYKLQVTDDSQCGPIFSTDIQIPEINGISLDESKVQTTIAACGMNNGTITGMQVTGTAQYKWANANNNVVATTIDLKNAAPGDYTFTAYNNSGCSKTSKAYHVGTQAVTQYPSYTVNTVAACPGQNNGSINVSTDALVASLRWVNTQGQNVGSSQLLSNVSIGTYHLYFTDANGCETFYSSYTVTELSQLTITNQGQITGDQCGLKTGAINNVSTTGGQSPYTYTWTDGNGNQIGTGSSISNLAAGDYHLNIADSRCGNLTVDYAITSQSEYVAAPPVSDVQLCSSGDAFVSVNNPSSTFTYRLYDDQNSAQPLDVENSGRFKVTISNNRSYFISQLNGTCESTRSEVKVTVGISGVNIPNAFTPNGDGINDYWNLKGMENNPNSLVQVFTRYGQKVFESRGYEHPFDGTSGGKELPSGVYYYIINLGTSCNVLSGNVTIIR